MITSKNVLNHELIGLNVRVKNSSIYGLVMDETKNTLIIRHDKIDKVVPKKNHEFEFELSDGVFAVRGSLIMQRPYERLKKEYKVNNKWEKTLVSKV